MNGFYGFKLYVVIDYKGEIMAYKFTGAKKNDCKVINTFTEGLTVKLVCYDKGYLENHYWNLGAKRGYN